MLLQNFEEFRMSAGEVITTIHCNNKRDLHTPKKPSFDSESRHLSVSKQLLYFTLKYMQHTRYNNPETSETAASLKRVLRENKNMKN
jgi:hypothetical protein